MLECDLHNKLTQDDLVLVCWSTFCREDRFFDGDGTGWYFAGNIHNNQKIYNEEWRKKYDDYTSGRGWIHQTEDGGYFMGSGYAVTKLDSNGNIGVNGARITSAEGLVDAFKRDKDNDKPVLLWISLIGNDVCNGHRTFRSSPARSR